MQGLEDIPELFGDFLSISTEAAQLILSIVVLLAVVIPIMIVSRGAKSNAIEAVMGFVTACALVAIGWLPVWVLIVITMIVALLWSRTLSDTVTGGD